MWRLPAEIRQNPAAVTSVILGSVSKHLGCVVRISRWALAHGSLAAYLPWNRTLARRG